MSLGNMKIVNRVTLDSGLVLACLVSQVGINSWTMSLVSLPR